MRDTIGIVFDIEEFAVYDGPGIRIAVFLKGCPLRCEWCHNPEGLSPGPERTVTKSLCNDCGRCREVCPSPDHCTACGACVAACPQRAIQISGKPMRASDVAAKIQRHAKVLRMNGGGVTFSGGEALMQSEFVADVCDRLVDVHKAIETSGYASEEAFLSVISRMDLVMMDIKHTDPVLHRRYTGVSNERILKNLALLIRSGRPFRARIPVIPGVNDSDENFEATAKLIAGAENLECVELLRYNRSAGAKYGLLGREYAPSFDPEREPNINLSIFEQYGMKAVAL